jgi:hypothetical protein
MHETYRMLGKEREADLQREAQRIRRAATIGRTRSPGTAPSEIWYRKVPGFVRILAARFGHPKFGPGRVNPSRHAGSSADGS